MKIVITGKTGEGKSTISGVIKRWVKENWGLETKITPGYSKETLEIKDGLLSEMARHTVKSKSLTP